MSAPLQLSRHVLPPSRDITGFQLPGARIRSGSAGLIAKFLSPLKLPFAPCPGSVGFAAWSYAKFQLRVQFAPPSREVDMKVLYPLANSACTTSGSTAPHTPSRHS